MYHVGSPVSTAPLQVVQLAEDLKLALELQPNQEERESLRAQLPSETTQALINWLQNGEVSIQTCLIYRIAVHEHLHSAAFITLSPELLEMSPFVRFPIMELWISESTLTSQKKLQQKLCGHFCSSYLHQEHYISFQCEELSPPCKACCDATVVFVNAPVSQSVAAQM